MNKKAFYSILSIFLVFVLVGLYVTAPKLTINNEELSSTTINDAVEYHSKVCVSTTGEFEGRTTPSSQDVDELVQCDHNLVTNAGLNAIRDVISGTGGSAFDFIGLCNSTTTTTDPGGCITPVATNGTAIPDEYGSTGNLTRGRGVITDLNQNGNISISYTFTASTNNLATNLTGLYNASSATGGFNGTLLAQNTFTEVTLQSADRLTINWTIWFA